MCRDPAERRFHVGQFVHSPGRPVEGVAILLFTLVRMQEALDPLGQILKAAAADRESLFICGRLRPHSRPTLPSERRLPWLTDVIFGQSKVRLYFSQSTAVGRISRQIFS